MEICSWRGRWWLKWYRSHWEPHVIPRCFLKRDFVVTRSWARLPSPIFHLPCTTVLDTEVIASGVKLPPCLCTRTCIQRLKELQSPHLARKLRSCCSVNHQPSAHREARWGSALHPSATYKEERTFSVNLIRTFSLQMASGIGGLD